jgi:hypothetical protein
VIGALGSLACSNSEINSENINPFRHWVELGWRGVAGVRHKKA